MTIINKKNTQDIINVISQAGIAIIPTETVYGIVCMPNIDSAIEQIYKIKGRDADQPLQILIDEPDQVNQYIDDKKLTDKLSKYWPGSLTAILPINKIPLNIFSSKLIYKGGIGLRCPDDQIARDIINKSGGALAATSANKSNVEPNQDPNDINKVFNDKLLILDDGKRHNVAGSTVINYIPVTPVIVRRGVLSDVAINDLMET